ncbi:hypothetical protein M9Y10_004153 [Tritrichomonas musculus]|uniref:Uncharacterized protein n=1 Tax=Tritrichomonas musculus TaxID=1915356 RepID=A0ABR2JT79_9EUKA
MLLFLIYLSKSARIFDYTDIEVPPSLTLYMNPFDNVQIKLNYKTPTYLSDLSKLYELYFDIDAEDPQGNTDTYGTFSHNSYIIGIIFDSKNYTISFINEGSEIIKFALVFSNTSYFPPQFKFPIKKYNFDDLVNENDPFLYDVGNQYSYAIFIILAILCFIYIVLFRFFCCDLHYCCFMCCYKKSK